MPRLRNQKDDEFSADKKKKNTTRSKWRLNRPRGQERSLAKREMALAEVRQREVAKELYPFRRQVLRRIFTGLRRTASMPSKASWGRCSSRRVRRSLNASRKLTNSTFMSRRTARSTRFLSNSGTLAKRSTSSRSPKYCVIATFSTT